MVLNYDPSDLLAAGIDCPTKLNLLFWDGAAWQPILPCAGCSLDTTNHKLTIVLDHFTEFTLAVPIEHQVFVPLVHR
jgi:hypothetical protein